MIKDWADYFRIEYEIEKIARHAGVKDPAAVAARLAQRCLRPPRPAEGARLLALAMSRAKEKKAAPSTHTTTRTPARRKRG